MIVKTSEQDHMLYVNDQQDFSNVVLSSAYRSALHARCAFIKNPDCSIVTVHEPQNAPR